MSDLGSPRATSTSACEQPVLQLHKARRVANENADLLLWQLGALSTADEIATLAARREWRQEQSA